MRIRNRTVYVSQADVRCFKAVWPNSGLGNRPYKFEFDWNGDLIDTNLPESHDGRAALALSDDCRDYLLTGVKPSWLA